MNVQCKLQKRNQNNVHQFQSVWCCVMMCVAFHFILHGNSREREREERESLKDKEEWEETQERGLCA